MFDQHHRWQTRVSSRGCAWHCPRGTHARSWVPLVRLGITPLHTILNRSLVRQDPARPGRGGLSCPGVHADHRVPPSCPLGDGESLHWDAQGARSCGALGALFEEDFILQVRFQVQEGHLYMDKYRRGIAIMSLSNLLWCIPGVGRAEPSRGRSKRI